MIQCFDHCFYHCFHYFHHMYVFTLCIHPFPLVSGGRSGQWGEGDCSTADSWSSHVTYMSFQNWHQLPWQDSGHLTEVSILGRWGWLIQKLLTHCGSALARVMVCWQHQAIAWAKVYTDFVTIYGITRPQWVKPPPNKKKSKTHLTKSASLLLMTWRHQEPGHQQP